MKSLKNLYKCGPGPSSSHTIGPSLAAKHFKNKIKDLKYTNVVVTLYGSLALTGKGHRTDKIIESVFDNQNIEIKFDYKTEKNHPNVMDFFAFCNGELILKHTYYSLGGGSLDCDEDHTIMDQEVYPFKDFKAIKKYMLVNKMKHLYEIAYKFEPDIYPYMYNILNEMLDSVKRGLEAKGQIQAGKTLYIDRSARMIYAHAKKTVGFEKKVGLISSYAYAVSEENAAGGKVVTSPTCGSAGVLPAIMYYLYKNARINKKILTNALISAGIIGDLFKQNATISGAVGGCQAEIGVAVCMASVALSDIASLNLYQTEYGCELAMEHQLGLTCDPFDGFVVIPCIERNAVGAIRAYEAYLFAKCIAMNRKHLVGLDDIINTMMATGKEIPESLKETSKAGLAKLKF